MRDVVRYSYTGYEIPYVIAHSETVRLNQLDDAMSVWMVILRATAEKHVVVQVFSDTFVTVERMKLPSSVQTDAIDNKQQNAYQSFLNYGLR